MDNNIIVNNYLDTFYCFEVLKDKFCEETVSEHMLMYLVSGEMDLISPDRTYHVKKGEAVFVRKNHLMKKVKRTGRNGEPFKGLFIQLKAPFLKKVMQEARVAVPLMAGRRQVPPYTVFEPHPFMQSLFTSFLQYFSAGEFLSEQLLESKLREAVFVTLQLKPQLAPVLFDFAEPWRVSIRDFMEQNYKCDLTVEEMAHYTGRSLTAFKQEFAKTFDTTPSRWIVRQRLSEARRLMTADNRKASDVYLEVGFKSLSHFSTAFKREFGIAPSELAETA